MSNEHIIAPVMEHINNLYGGKTSGTYATVEDLEKALENTYWKHDSERHASHTDQSYLPVEYYKFKQLMYTGGHLQRTKSVGDESNWKIEFTRHPAGTSLLPLSSIHLMTQITDPDEAGMVALMFL